MGVLFYSFSLGLWSSDKEWLDMIRIKLPLLFLPIALRPFIYKKTMGVAGVYFYSSYYRRYFMVYVIITGYSRNTLKDILGLKPFLHHWRMTRVRFSWLVSIAALLAGWLHFQNKSPKREDFIGLIKVAGWLAVFLHILAVGPAFSHFIACCL
ncbi:MAG: hypothetical protein IPQ25_12105 [Chitinophagaceae bacterium]|nr:hypothetical protein [Chitinophagaceae bacterium]